MTTEEDDVDDIELYGVSPGIIAFFMILISLIVPMGVIPFNAWTVTLGYQTSEFMIYSLIWVYAPGFFIPFQLLPIFLLLNIWMTIPLTIFNVAYIWKIIRYYRGQCTRYSVIWVGILSITIPTLFALLFPRILVPGTDSLFVGPIPLQFIVGLIFLYKFPGPEMTSPWRYDLGDNSWWKPKRPDWWYRLFPKEDNPEDIGLDNDS